MTYLSKFLKFCVFLILLFSCRLDAAHGTVQGTVTDQFGNPISGATVSFYRIGGILEATRTTDANGFYSYSNDPHNYIMTVNKTGYEQVVIGFKMLSNETVTIDVSMSGSPATIQGQVNGPLPGSTTLKLYLNNVLVGQTNDSSGSFSFPNLSPGTYVVTASSAGYGTQSQSATVAAGDTANLTFNLTQTSGSLAGNASDGLTPIPGAAIQVYQNNILVAQAFTDISGNYTISGLLPGDYTVQASAESYSSNVKGTTILASQQTTCNFVLTQDPGLLEGFVYDNLSQPITSALIQVLQNNIVIFSTYSGSDGSYFVNRLAPGSYTVVASKANYQTSTKGAIIVADQITYLNFNLMPDPGAVVGTVTTGGSTPLAGVLVEVNQNNIVLFTTLTDANGQYNFTSLAPGSYVIHAHDSGYQSGIQGAIVQSNSSTTANFDLLPDPGAVVGTVTTGGSTPLAGVLVEVNQNNIVLFTTLTDANGQYSFTSLAPGSYVIHAHDGGYQSGVKGAIVQSNSSTTVNFDLLPDPGSLVGKVTNGSSPLSGVLIEVNYANVVLFSTLTDSFGNYVIGGITPGVYTIHAHASNYQDGIKAGILIISDKETVVNFTLLENPATVKGTVQDGGTLALLPGVSVELNVNNVVVDSCLTNSQGQYLFTNQASGNYVMHAHLAGYATGIASITLTPSQELIQNFSLTNAANTLGGVVRNSQTSSLVSGVFVELYVQNGSFDYIDTTVSTTDGVYGFTNLASGSYKIIARRSGFEPHFSNVILLNSSASYDFNMIPLPLAPLNGSGEVLTNRFLLRADRMHKIVWEQSPSENVTGYNVYRNSQLMKYISKNEPLIYLDHNRNYNELDTYEVISVSENGYEGGVYVVSLR